MVQMDFPTRMEEEDIMVKNRITKNSEVIHK